MSEETDPPKLENKSEPPSGHGGPWHLSAIDLKSWAEGISASVKAMLYTGALLVAVVAAAKLIWREETTHALRLEVSHDAQEALVAHGGDLDLSLALEDALNERLEAVRQIIEVQGLTVVGGSTDPQSVSFKPFGVEVTTDDLTRLTNLILNRPPPPSVRLQLFCAPQSCASGSSRLVSLVTTVSQAGGMRRADYKLGGGTAGLRRSLRRAIQNTADLVLAQSEPAIASVWFLNRAGAASISLSDYQQDLALAIGAAERATAAEGSADCIADLVTGSSLMARNEVVQGVSVEQLAYARPSDKCQIHAATNIIFNLVSPAYCGYDPVLRSFARSQIQAALAHLPAYSGKMSDIVYLRIPTARLNISLMDLIEQEGADTLQNFCAGRAAADHGVAGRFALRWQRVRAQLLTELPPHPEGAAAHAIILSLWNALHVGIPRDDLEGRIVADRELLQLIQGFIGSDAHARMPDFIAGQAAMDICSAIIAVTRLPPEKQLHLAQLFEAPDASSEDDASAALFWGYNRFVNSAVIWLADAKATEPVPLTDPANSEISALLGNAALMAGNPTLAVEGYGHVVDSFHEANEPVEQFPVLADALARWGRLRVALGACLPDAAPDQAWAGAWASLGTDAPNFCALKPGDHVQPARNPQLESLLERVHAEMRRCPVPDGTVFPPDPGYISLATASWSDLIECSDTARTKNRFIVSRTPTGPIDAELAQALATVP